VIIPLPGTCAGGRGGTGIATTGLAERRQVVEVVIQREVIEYRIVSGTCACGRAQRSTFPAGIEAPVQYGPGGSAFAVYMTPYPLRPYQRTAEVLNERAGLAISPGTLQRTVRVVAARLEAPVTAIRDALVAAPVVPTDETSRRVNGNLYRLGGYASAATRFCISSPTCAFPATTTRPNATFACPNSSRKSPVVSAPIPEPGTLPSSAPTSQLSANTGDIFNSLVLTFQGRPPMSQLEQRNSYQKRRYLSKAIAGK